MKNELIDAVYCSTSNRTFETVKLIAQIKGLQVKREEDLCEMYFGIYDGWKWEDVNKVNPLIHKKHMETNEIMCIPEQETTMQVAERMYKKMTEIAIKNIGKTILIVSHGVAIETFLRTITQDKFTTKIMEYSQHNGSINILNFDTISKMFTIAKLNDINYMIETVVGK